MAICLLKIANSMFYLLQDNYICMSLYMGCFDGSSPPLSIFHDSGILWPRMMVSRLVSPFQKAEIGNLLLYIYICIYIYLCICIYIYTHRNIRMWGGVEKDPLRRLSQGIIRTQVLYKGIWVWRTFHEEFEALLGQLLMSCWTGKHGILMSGCC